jgi:hypothetical protein
MKYEFEVNLKPVWHKKAETCNPIKTPGILKSLVTAYQIADYMRANDIGTLKGFCRKAKITTARATQLIRLLQLSPCIQEAILSSRYATTNLTEHDIRPITMEIIWEQQNKLWMKQHRKDKIS